MTNLQIIQKLKNTTFTDEDGEAYQLEFLPGMTDGEIEELRLKFPAGNLEDELIEILKFTRGWDGYGIEAVYFDSIEEFGFWELSSNSLTLGYDGFGNMWVLDLGVDGKLGKVFFACHDPAVFVIISQNLNEYLQHLLEFHENPSSNHINTVYYQAVSAIWDDNKYCMSKQDFLNNNPTYEPFLNEFEGAEWTVADLRNAPNKAGFAWGKMGPNNFTKRHPEELIWVMKNKKKGLLARLLRK